MGARTGRAVVASGQGASDFNDLSGDGVLLLGATGRVGRMLLASGGLPGAVPQARRPLAGHLHWDPLNHPAADLPPVSAIVMMAGDASDPDCHVPLARAAAAAGAARQIPVLIASSQAVYGRGAGPHAEDGPCDPAGAYGEAKLAMEAAVADQPHVTCLRIGNVAGADGLFRSMTAGPVALDEVQPGQGPLRAMIGPETLAACLRGLLALEARPRIVNLAQPGLMDMADLLRAAMADWQWRPAPPGVLPRLALDLTRLQDLIPVPEATPRDLVDQALRCGWSPA